MKAFFVLVSCFVLAIAQQPKPCEFPPKWEARYFMYQRGSLLEESGTMTYDEVEQRVRFVIREIDGGEEIDAFEIIVLYLKNIEYRYDYRTQLCTSRPITYPFRPYGVPQNATSFGQFYIGTSGDPEAGMLVNVYGGEFIDGELAGDRYETTVTAGACIPVNDIFFRKVGNRYEETVTDFFDVIAQIPDPDVFNPPSVCF